MALDIEKIRRDIEEHGMCYLEDHTIGKQVDEMIECHEFISEAGIEFLAEHCTKNEVRARSIVSVVMPNSRSLPVRY
jgi:hypothetical protein